MEYYWLSFVNVESVPHKHLGVVIIKERNEKFAFLQASVLGLNPGGEVIIVKVDKNELIENNLELNKLYSREELIERGYKSEKEKKNDNK